jgi:dephospho-CoA kinase
MNRWDGARSCRRIALADRMYSLRKQHEENKEELQAYKFQNPSFKAKLDKVRHVVSKDRTHFVLDRR